MRTTALEVSFILIFGRPMSQKCSNISPSNVSLYPKLKMYSVLLFLNLLLLSVSANLEGPFLFWGPKSLEQYRRPALSFVEQDELTTIYGSQPAIVVFNNQDSVSLSSGNFPRLRKMLEGKSSLVLSQDFLDVHPDYVSNETMVSDNHSCFTYYMRESSIRNN